MSPIQTKSSMSAFSDDLSIPDGEKPTASGFSELTEDPGLDPLANAGERRKFNTGSLVLVGVIGLAFAGLWFMRALTRVSGASSGSADIEMTIERFLNTFKGQTAASDGMPSKALTTADPGILAVLSETYSRRQVPLDSVQRNPFILPGEDIITPQPAGPIDDAGKSMAKRQAERRAAFEMAASRLELKSVIMSSVPLANVSGKIVRKGDEIVAESGDIAFRVDVITGDSVTIVGEDVLLNLSLPFTITLKRDR